MIDSVTFKALKKASEAFYDYFEKEGLDGAYWDIEFTAWELDMELNRARRITIEHEVKEQKTKECKSK